MLKVKLGLDRLSIPQKLQLTQAIVGAMTGNDSFPTPNPSLANVTSSASFLQNALTARDGLLADARQATTQLGTDEAALDAILSRLAAYVEGVANAPGVTPDAGTALIQSAGMAVAGSGGHARPGPLPQPEDLSATLGDAPGEVDLHWHAVRGAKSYVVRYTTDPTAAPASWTTTLPSSPSKMTVSGLVSGTMYWFQVMAVGTGSAGDNNSPWSAQTNCRAA